MSIRQSLAQRANHVLKDCRKAALDVFHGMQPRIHPLKLRPGRNVFGDQIPAGGEACPYSGSCIIYKCECLDHPPRLYNSRVYLTLESLTRDRPWDSRILSTVLPD